MSDWSDINGRCDKCEGEDVPVRYTENPFIAEVYPEDDNPKSNWCEDCWDTVKADV